MGKFDIAKFKQYFKTNPEQAKAFEEREESDQINAKFQIYSTLIKSGMYTTNADGEFKYKLEADKVNFDYVAVLYSSIKDSDVKVTDAPV